MAKRIYLASSWRNADQPRLVKLLREAGHVVYDFRNPRADDHGFGWTQCGDSDAALKDPRRFRDEILTHWRAVSAFAQDYRALLESQLCVLALPCGRSAHLELGIATGRGIPSVVLLDEPMSEPELMYLACSRIVVGDSELLAACAELGAP